MSQERVGFAIADSKESITPDVIFSKREATQRAKASGQEVFRVIWDGETQESIRVAPDTFGKNYLRANTAMIDKIASGIGKSRINEGVGEYIVKFTSKETYQGDDDGDEGEYDPYVGSVDKFYDILLNGKKVGELATGGFGHIHGTLHKKDLPDLSHFAKKRPEQKYNTAQSGPQEALHAFLKSKSGQRWMNNLKRYSRTNDEYGSSLKGLDSSKTKPMPDWAMKESSMDDRGAERAAKRMDMIRRSASGEDVGFSQPTMKTLEPNDEFPAPWRVTRSPEGICDVYSGYKQVGSWLTQDEAEHFVNQFNYANKPLKENPGLQGYEDEEWNSDEVMRAFRMSDDGGPGEKAIGEFLAARINQSYPDSVTLNNIAELANEVGMDRIGNAHGEVDINGYIDYVLTGAGIMEVPYEGAMYENDTGYMWDKERTKMQRAANGPGRDTKVQFTILDADGQNIPIERIRELRADFAGFARVLQARDGSLFAEGEPYNLEHIQRQVADKYILRKQGSAIAEGIQQVDEFVPALIGAGARLASAVGGRAVAGAVGRGAGKAASAVVNTAAASKLAGMATSDNDGDDVAGDEEREERDDAFDVEKDRMMSLARALSGKA